MLVDLLCNSPFYCGELTQALVEAGVDAELASPKFYLEPLLLDPCPRPAWIIDLAIHVRQPRVLRLAARAIEGALNFASLLWRVCRGCYDVVHVQWIPLESRKSPFMALLRSACDATDTRLVFTAHNALPHDGDAAVRVAVRSNLRRAHLVIVHTSHVKAELVDEVGVKAPIVEIPHGPLFTTEELVPRDEARRRLGLLPGPMVLFLGLIRPYKGLDFMRRAWPLVAASHPGATFLVVGKPLDHHAAADLDALRELAGVRVVDHYVPVPEMLDCYAAADLVVFPYHRISQSAGLMTAAGLGRPSVITPIAGLLEQAAGLRSIVVAEQTEAEAIAAAISTGLDRRDELAAAAAEDRRDIATSPIGWPVVARATRMAYETAPRF